MIKQATTRTITEVTVGPIGTINSTVDCFASMNDDGTENPTIYRSMVLETPLTVDTASGVEGELILLSDEENVGVLDNNGELTLTLETDDVNKYSVNATQGDLEYEE